MPQVCERGPHAVPDKGECREMQHRIKPFAFQNRVQERVVGQVAHDQRHIGGERGPVPRAEIVEHDNRMTGVAQGKDYMAADKAGAPSHQVMHRCFSCLLVMGWKQAPLVFGRVVFDRAAFRERCGGCPSCTMHCRISGIYYMNGTGGCVWQEKPSGMQVFPARCSMDFICLGIVTKIFFPHGKSLCVAACFVVGIMGHMIRNGSGIWMVHGTITRLWTGCVVSRPCRSWFITLGTGWMFPALRS